MSSSSELVPGRITQFKREQGFGTITLEDGREVPFDAQICELSPEEGMRVRVQVGKAKWGNTDKAVLVKPESDGAVILANPATPAALGVDGQVALLQAHDLIANLSEAGLARILGELGARATLLGVLDRFYASDPARAVADGYVRCAAIGAAEPGDLLAAFTRVAPAEARLPVQGPWTQRDGGGWTTQLALPDGVEIPLDVESVDDVVAVVNAALEGGELAERVWPLATGDDSWHAYLVLPRDRAGELAQLLPFAVIP